MEIMRREIDIGQRRYVYWRYGRKKICFFLPYYQVLENTADSSPFINLC